MTKVVVAEAYGGPEVLAVRDVTLPPVGPGQVAVDVRAAGTNPFDYKRYSGQMGDDPGALPIALGLEVSGVVAEAPARAEGYTGPLKVGDEVIGAIGVAGAGGAKNDEACAVAAIEKLLPSSH